MRGEYTSIVWVEAGEESGNLSPDLL